MWINFWSVAGTEQLTGMEPHYDFFLYCVSKLIGSWRQPWINDLCSQDSCHITTLKIFIENNVQLKINIFVNEQHSVYYD